MYQLVFKLCTVIALVGLSLLPVELPQLCAEDDTPEIPEDILKKLREQIEKSGGTLIIRGGDDEDGASPFGDSDRVHESPDPHEKSVKMPWRIYTNQDAGMAFRFPYYYRILDQYGSKMMRHYGRYGGQADLEFKTAKIKDISEEAGGDDIEKLARHLLGERKKFQDISFTDYDYYANVESRPHAGAKWALEGISAIRGEGENGSALFVIYNGVISGLMSDGGLGYNSNSDIFDTLEVMNRSKKYRKREKGPLRTWRQNACAQKKVFTYQDNLVKVNNVGPVDWDQRWELETEHYHLTSQVSPGHLYYYGMLCEALWREFYKVYEPDTLIPYKMEIHIFNTQRNFADGASTIGAPVGPGVGGFFSPSLLCIYAYEQSTKIAADFTPSKVLGHELSHQFLHLSCNGTRHVPTWINEGLAVYFETFDFKKGKYIGKAPKSRIRQLAMVYSQTKDVVWKMDDYIEHYGHIPAINYAEVYAMTHFWIFGDPKGKERFRKYWKALKAGENGSEAFERIFMKDLIAARGSRSAALGAWTEALKLYVTKTLTRLK